MTRRELIQTVHEGTGGALSQQQIADVIDRTFAAIAEAIRRDGRYSHPGFGTFTVRVQNPRPGRNPQTGEAIEIAGGATIGFKPAEALKDGVQR